MDEKRYSVMLTASQIENLMDFIDLEFIASIRRDEDVDNIAYLRDISDAYMTLKAKYDELKKDGESDETD